MNTRMNRLNTSTWVLALVFATAPWLAGAARASAFQLDTGGADNLGRANSGGTLWEGDASAAYGNPAAMAWATAPAIKTSLTLIQPDIRFRGDVSDWQGAPIAGPDANGGKRAIPVPALYAMRPLTERVALGTYVTAPYGAATRYANGWRGRQFGVRTEIKSVAVGASLAWRVSDSVSLGAGAAAQYTRIQLSTGTDLFSTLQELGAVVSPLTIAQTHVAMRTWSPAWFLGASFRPSDRQIVGIAYHAAVRNRLRGNYRLYFPNDATLAATGEITAREALALVPLINGSLPAAHRLPELDADGGRARARFDMPAWLDIDWIHQLTDRLAVGASVRWTQWSRLASLDLEAGTGPSLSQPLRYRNAMRWSTTAQFQATDKLALRIGAGYDQTPTHTATRDLRIPDQSRRLLSVGLGYQLGPGTGVDVGYMHQFVSDARLRSRAPSGLGGGTIDGRAKVGGRALSVSASLRF